MFRVKKIIVVAIMGIVVLTSAYGVKAGENFYAKGGKEGNNVYVMAYTTSGVKTTTTKYGIVPNKYVKYVEVTLTELGKVKKDRSSNGVAKASKVNNPLVVAKGTWHWEYK